MLIPSFSEIVGSGFWIRVSFKCLIVAYSKDVGIVESMKYSESLTAPKALNLVGVRHGLNDPESEEIAEATSSKHFSSMPFLFFN